jgi:hypothetical protein
LDAKKGLIIFGSDRYEVDKVIDKVRLKSLISQKLNNEKSSFLKDKDTMRVEFIEESVEKDD